MTYEARIAAPAGMAGPIPNAEAAADRVAGKRLVTYGVVGIVLCLGYVFLRDLTWQGGAHFHTIMEAVATVLALIVGIMALARFYSKKNNTFLFIGAGFLGTAFLDGYHATVTSEFFASYLPSSLPSLIPWSWVASRAFLSILMLLSWAAWVREQRMGRAGRIQEHNLYLFVALLTLLSFLFFAFTPLPRAYYPEFVFHRPEELIPALFFFLALTGYLRKGDWRHDVFEHWLVLSLIVGFLGQAVFMSFSGQLFDFQFDAAHLLKKASYICVFVGLVFSMYSIFQQAEEANIVLQVEVNVRKKTEAALQQRAQELARSNKELEQFAYVASHDLQEPLRKVKAFGDRLMTKYGEALDDRGRDYISRMQDAAERMQMLIGSLLTFSRVGTSGEPFAKVDLDKVARDIVSDLEVPIRETGARVTAVDLPIIDADPLQMRQLLQNLIGNALKYRRKGVPPLIEVSAKILPHEAPDRDGIPAGSCRISVKDNGIGFEDQYLERIFGIFQRLHGRDEYEGTGIGLSIARKIVERHGGSITAESRSGEGSTFIVNLPMNQIIHEHNHD
jgi:signal transduction histidine kinase